MMKNIYSVTQINNYIKNMFQQDFMMHRIYIKGEISNCKYSSKGHLFFTLKDETGALPAVMFVGNLSGLNFPMKNGDNVIALGSMIVYEKEGKYQLSAEQILLEGTGQQYQKYEALKKQLKEMGMFDDRYKKPIPKYVQRVGVVTSLTGDAIRDIQNVASRRNPYVQLILYPTLVQGNEAAASIVKGIQALDKLGVDVIIVGRGGGSDEHLWAFNEEIVARAVFACETPVISAVGHELDVALIDSVADLRAPTPSAAAELAVFDVNKLLDQIILLQSNLNKAMKNRLDICHEKVRQTEIKLDFLKPENRLNERKKYCVELEKRLMVAMELKLMEVRHRMELYAGNLEGLSPLKKLSQGYSVVTDSQGKNITDVSDVEIGDTLTVHLINGQIEAQVSGVNFKGD